MQLLTLFSVFFLYLHLTFSEIEICKQSTPCTCKFESGLTVELSGIGRPGNPRFVVGSEGNFYLYNPCYPFSFDTQVFRVDRHPCSNVAACLLSPENGTGGPPTQRSLGLQNSAVFFSDDGVLKISYSATVPVHAGVENFTIILECDEKVQYKLDVRNKTDFVLTTYCACQNNDRCKPASPSHSKSGLSTGSILLITFFVIILVYFGVGVLLNFCRGAHGTELLPNVEFWNELPKLIVDGFLFTCSCFRGRSSYADV